jgi:hypothetical protein
MNTQVWFRLKYVEGSPLIKLFYSDEDVAAAEQVLKDKGADPTNRNQVANLIWKNFDKGKKQTIKVKYRKSCTENAEQDNTPTIVKEIVSDTES